MKIKSIRMLKYKRFYDLTINLNDPKRIVALVGPNGCGKSSVFDAMLYLHNAYRRIGNSDYKDYTYHSLEQNPGYRANENITIGFDTGTFLQVITERRKQGTDNTVFSFRSCFRYNSSLNIKELRAIDPLIANNYGASSSSDIDQRIDQSYNRLNIKYNKYMNDMDCKPSEARKHTIGELNSALQSCLDLRIADLGDIQDGKGTFFFSKPDTNAIFRFDVLSSGEKEVIDLLVDLYLRKEEYSDSIYIIDEPELHLNTAMQRNLLRSIVQLVPNNCQIWIATHSIGFMRGLQDDLKEEAQIIEFKPKNEWASKPYVLEPMKKSRKNWLSLFSTALDDLANLVSPKRLIYCEGKAQPSNDNDEKGLDANVYNIIFGENYPDTLFISSGGNTELDQRSEVAIKILSKVFHDIEIWILKDLDSESGRPVNQETRQQYLTNHNERHRMLKRFEIENYLYDKEVLQAYCKKNSQEFNEAEYNKLVENISYQNVKDKTGEIKKICGVSKSISKAKFKLDLASIIDANMLVYKELKDIIFHNSSD